MISEFVSGVYLASVVWKNRNLVVRDALRGLSAIAQLQVDMNQLKIFRKLVLIVTGKNTGLSPPH